jgi:hypothetical protein
MLIIVLASDSADAIDTIEAVGAERCGGPVKSFEVDFLAPDTVTVEGTVKSVLNGVPVAAPNAASLTIDGRQCTDARCTFEAKKGQTYRFTATSNLPKVDRLCISVARP